MPVAIIVEKAFEADGWQRSATVLAALVAVVLVGAAVYSGISDSFSKNKVWALAQVAGVDLLFWIGRSWIVHKDKSSGL